jgi:uncharacterized protein (DUF952 family)
MNEDGDTFIFKIFRLPEWNAAEEVGIFTGSADDIRDGFLHFSLAEQVRGTAEKHFPNESEIMLAQVEARALGASLKWEVSRGGQTFPHLYAPLSMSLIQQTWRVARKNGQYVFPDEVP